MPTLTSPSSPEIVDAMRVLLGCHDDIRRLSTLMLRLDVHLIHYGVDDDACGVASDILHYFESDVPLHHADEQGGLFPALRTLGGAALERTFDALDAEYDTLTRMWRSVRPWLQSVQQRRPCARPAALGAFATRYPAYADREEREVYGVVSALPPDEALAFAQSIHARQALRSS